MISTLANIEFEFDHVGIAVTSLAEGEKVYKAMGFQEGITEEVLREKVRVRMFELGNQSRVELLEPLDAESPVAKFLDKRGPGIHHICLRVKDIRATLKRLKLDNIRLIHEEPFLGAHNCMVAFIHPASAGGVLVELSQPSEGAL
jgi:methylmalonyl-CoA/ethylmalonyl-CoA epimerase